MLCMTDLAGRWNRAVHMYTLLIPACLAHSSLNVYSSILPRPHEFDQSSRYVGRSGSDYYLFLYCNMSPCQRWQTNVRPCVMGHSV
jgi:hypothetical protein